MLRRAARFIYRLATLRTAAVSFVVMDDFSVAASLASLVKQRKGRTKRVSSWDRTGGNHDWVPFDPREAKTLAEVSGAGVIRHIWFTINHRDRMYLRRMVLRAYWDGNSHPSIESPVGDFFCLGHGINNSFENAAFNAVSHQNSHGELGGGVALNCYFQMPFANGMRIEIENESEEKCDSFYYYIDYDELPFLDEHTLRFHAHYRQEFPTVVKGGTLISHGEHYWDHMADANIGGEDNYLILETEGSGHYVGCTLSVENIDPHIPKKRFGITEVRVPELTWWGEGDDMIWIDDDTWPPSLHGTGSEDYLTHAWGMHDERCLYGGTTIHEFNPKFPDRRVCTSYRLHILDAVLFQKKIKVTIEHGHANLQQNNYSSVAYWYQNPGCKPFPPLPKAEERLPLFYRSPG